MPLETTCRESTNGCCLTCIVHGDGSPREWAEAIANAHERAETHAGENGNVQALYTPIGYMVTGCRKGCREEGKKKEEKKKRK